MAAQRRAQDAWDNVHRAEEEYHQLCLEFKQEDQALRQAAGLCGPERTPHSSVSESSSRPSVEVLTKDRNGKEQVILRERSQYNPWQTSTGKDQVTLYPTLQMGKDGKLLPEYEKEPSELSFKGLPTPKKEDKDEPTKVQEDQTKATSIVDQTMHTSPPLRIQDIKRVVIPLIPGNEVAWAILTEQAVKRGKKGEETMILQALMPQLSGHTEASSQATMLLVQAANDPVKGGEVLTTFFQWLLSRYRLTPRQKRANFIRKLREMQWTWQVNPADVLTGIITTSQLTWDQVLGNPALKEELEATLASNLDISLHLQITKRDPKDWRKAITDVWERVKDSAGLKTVEIYMHEGEEDSDSEDEDACMAEMPSAAVAQAPLPKIRNPKIDLKSFDKKLDMVVSALQAQEITKGGQQGQAMQKPIVSGQLPQNQMSQEQAVPGQSMQMPNAQQLGPQMQGKRPPLRCYWCHQEGHLKRNCPQRVNQWQGNGNPNRGGWNSSRGNWNSGRGGYNRNNWNHNRGNWNNNNGWYNGPAGRGRGGYQNNSQYRGNNRNTNWQDNSPDQNTNPQDMGYQEAQQVRQNIIQEGRPKASWANPSSPPDDDQPAIVADHAEANFVQGLSASERWKSETLRPPMMYDQAMAQLADTAPVLKPMDLPQVDFLGQRQRT